MLLFHIVYSVWGICCQLLVWKFLCRRLIISVWQLVVATKYPCCMFPFSATPWLRAGSFCRIGSNKNNPVSLPNIEISKWAYQMKAGKVFFHSEVFLPALWKMTWKNVPVYSFWLHLRLVCFVRKSVHEWRLEAKWQVWGGWKTGARPKLILSRFFFPKRSRSQSRGTLSRDETT